MLSAMSCWILFTIPRLVTRLVNSVMLDGKKGVAQKIVYEAFSMIQEKTGNDPLEVFEKAMENIMPSLELRPAVLAALTTRFPLEVSPARRETLGLRWLTTTAAAVVRKTMAQRLAAEIMDAANNTGGAARSARIPTRWPKPTRLSLITVIVIFL